MLIAVRRTLPGEK